MDAGAWVGERVHAQSSSRHMLTDAAVVRQSPRWHAALPTDTAAAALTTARQVAGRLREREQVEAAVAAAAQQSTQRVRWQAPSVAQGYAGLAILCSYLD